MRTPADVVEQSIYDLAWVGPLGAVIGAALFVSMTVSVLRRMARNA